jgi:hypothetical protein
MNQPPNPNEAVTGNDSPLDPHEAAALLDQATQQARRQFEPNPPLLSVIRAVVVLAAFGGTAAVTVWQQRRSVVRP